jgi:hypothetical protein
VKRRLHMLTFRGKKTKTKRKKKKKIKVCDYKFRRRVEGKNSKQ